MTVRSVNVGRKVADKIGGLAARRKIPVSELVLRAIYWGGSWAIDTPYIPRLSGYKLGLLCNISLRKATPQVWDAWRDWLRGVGVSPSEGILWLIDNYTMPPLPKGWEDGRLPLTVAYQQRRNFEIINKYRPKKRARG
jgi:hypothetical protein